MAKKYFTVEQANRLIPMIKREIDQLKSIQDEFDEKWNVYHSIKDNKTEHVTTQTGYLFKLECQLEFIEMQAQLHVSNIQNSGAQLKGIEPGLVDFPSFKGKKEILLCWKEGEDRIAFFHYPKDGYEGRRPL
ncbi:DUF2203 domain-containing protein [Alkalicoccus luteus]|uniref:DUF2203 domain-containing protein n=1 Tax=Alkalicoccus luteus TaxID=1237094 RepID=A0A969PQQ6_9BACI|nr:DUF2203 domain-containing protein [Alkalicoccus luteus]NJP37259.1 DUF2203 domain-containing protein [Alkalicoccus luteus]